MSIVWVCEGGHVNTMEGLVAVPRYALNGFNYGDKFIQAKCKTKDCKLPCLKDSNGALSARRVE